MLREVTHWHCAGMHSHDSVRRTPICCSPISLAEATSGYWRGTALHGWSRRYSSVYSYTTAKSTASMVRKLFYIGEISRASHPATNFH